MAYYNNYSPGGNGGLSYNLPGQDRRWGPQQPYSNLTPQRGYPGSIPPVSAMHQTPQSNKPFPKRRQSIAQEFKPNLLQQPHQTNRTDIRGSGANSGEDNCQGRGLPTNDLQSLNPGGFYSRNLPIYNESRTYNHGNNPYGVSYGGGYRGYNPYHSSPLNGSRYDDGKTRGGRGGGGLEMGTGARLNQFSFNDVVAERRVEHKQFVKKNQNSFDSQHGNQVSRGNFLRNGEFSPASSGNSGEKWWGTSSTSPSPKPTPKKPLKLADIERNTVVSKDKELGPTGKDTLPSLSNNKPPLRGPNDFVARNESKNNANNNKNTTTNNKNNYNKLPLKEGKDKSVEPLPKTVGKEKPKTVAKEIHKSRDNETIDGNKRDTKNISNVRNTPAKEIEKLLAKKVKKEALMKDGDEDGDGGGGRNNSTKAPPEGIQEDHLPDTANDGGDADEMEKLAELERISLRKAVMKQKQIYDHHDTTGATEKEKEGEKQPKYQKSRTLLEENDAIMDAIDEEGGEEKPQFVSSSLDGGSSERTESSEDRKDSSRSSVSGGSTLTGTSTVDKDEDDEVFVPDDDGDDGDDLEEWW